MFPSAIMKSLLRCSAIAAVVLLPRAEASPALPLPAVRAEANSNRSPAGSWNNSVLTLHLELRTADWYPEADTGSSMKVYAFQEEGKAPQIPGPLVRVPQGAEIRVTVHNLLPAAAVVHGLHQHPGDGSDVLEVPAGEIREARFSAGAPGTYQYWASAGGPLNRGRPFREDSQLAGGFVVDPTGTVAADRIFVIANWRSQLSAVRSQDVPVINGKSWPYTERLTYAAGEPVRWRWVNASDGTHPMHLHGSYYRVDSAGDGERDQVVDPERRSAEVTHPLLPGTTMSTSWTPPAGKWIFHCHLVAHFLPEMNVENALNAKAERRHDHGSNHMAGLVLGITVTGKRAAVVSHGHTRKLRLLVRERPAQGGLPAGFGYQWEQSGLSATAGATSPGAPLVLERGRPVEITVVNRLHEPTAVHWHGMELESYYDGVVGWGADGSHVTPAIEPNGSFRVRFTPPRAGTFIYHTHLNDEFQMASGLYGPMIVLEPGTKFDPATDPIFLLSRDGPDERTAARLLNGSAEPAPLDWRTGQQYRLRLIDIAPNNGGVFSLMGPAGMVQWRAVAKDGADLPTASAVMQEAQQVLFPGETYDFQYSAEKPVSLRLEVESPPGAVVHWKVVQRIEVR